MKRLVAILSVLVIQGSLWASPVFFAQKSECCRTSLTAPCHSQMVCCQSGDQKTTPVPSSSVNSQFGKLLHLVAPSTVIAFSGSWVVSHLPGGVNTNHAPPLFILKSSFLI